ncbi:MAG: hypothetical protein C5B48_16420 [Candidatus Rokuibacteriota bacterium]|nr:MAG: hypothetical protein C5B48_16420 [Candidatus Rokubacteria bacterium]
MIRLAAFVLALVLCAVPFRTAPLPPVGIVSLLGLLVAAVGIAALRRSLVTAAACVFLTDYAASLWLAGAPASLSGATAFGLLVFMLLQTVELARRTRRAVVDRGVVRSHLVRAVGLSALTLGAAVLIVALAGSLTTAVPFAAAPLIAAASALGVVLAVAAAVSGSQRGASRRD